VNLLRWRCHACSARWAYVDARGDALPVLRQPRHHGDDRMSNVAPPQNLEAEQELLGTLLVFYKPQLVHLAQAPA
jgi:hypothetical protein